jgi:hypothetical protein
VDLEAARNLWRQAPAALSASEGQELDQLANEVAIVASWPREPLDLILGRAAKLREEEWQAVIQRYLGKGMIFDVIVRRDVSGAYVARFQRDAANQIVRLQLQNQAVLKHLPLNEPHRLLLGGRLGEIHRDDQALVHVRLEADSAVLLTDTAVLKACGPAIDPAGLLELAERQKRWLIDFVK